MASKIKHEKGSKRNDYRIHDEVARQAHTVELMLRFLSDRDPQLYGPVIAIDLDATWFQSARLATMIEERHQTIDATQEHERKRDA